MTTNQKALSQETYATVIRSHIKATATLDQIATINIMIEAFEQRLQKEKYKKSEFVSKKEWVKDLTNRIKAYEQVKAEIRAERIEEILTRKEQ